METDDLDLALKLLNMTIFREEEQEDAAQGDDEMADEEAAEAENDQVVPLKQKSGRAQRSERRNRGGPDQDDEEVKDPSS